MNTISYNPGQIFVGQHCIIESGKENVQSIGKIVDIETDFVIVSYFKDNQLFGRHNYDKTTGVRHETARIVEIQITDDEYHQHFPQTIL